MPEGVAAAAADKRILTYLTLTAEPGILGPSRGLDFGAALNDEGGFSPSSSLIFTTAGSPLPTSATRDVVAFYLLIACNLRFFFGREYDNSEVQLDSSNR